MKIVNIIGGLGNQMFQYSFALSLKEKFPKEDVLIDTSHFNYIFLKKWKSANLHNGYEIDKVFPNASLKKASAWQLMQLTWYVPNYALSRIARRLLPQRKSEYVQPVKEYFKYDPDVYKDRGNCYYEGLWESITNILPVRSKIQEEFRHPKPNKVNSAYIAAMESTNSVGIHIRRGDYLQSAAFCGICDLGYYRQAISEIIKDGEKYTFYIFSNDMAWCEANIKPLVGDNEIVMVTENTGNDSCWDMFLMSHCKNLIIANSSFSWWGAFLNKRGGKVIAPQKWANREAEFDIWAPEWVRL